MFVFAASVSPPANVLANVCCLNRGAIVLICNWLDTHDSRNGLCGSSIKNGEPLQTLDLKLKVFDVLLVLILFDFFDSRTMTRRIEHCTAQSTGTIAR